MTHCSFQQTGPSDVNLDCDNSQSVTGQPTEWYNGEIAHAAEISGFQGGLLPSFPMTDEPWAISSFLARETRTFRFMIAFQPGFLNPVTAARMTASLQRATGAMLALFWHH